MKTIVRSDMTHRKRSQLVLAEPLAKIYGHRCITQKFSDLPEYRVFQQNRPEADLVRKVRKFTFGADTRIPLANRAADPDALIVFLELKAVDNKSQLDHSTYLGVF